jgi:hypothetical protein
MAKRRKIIDGVPHVRVAYTDACSGCFEGGDYMGLAHNYSYDQKASCHVGMGCKECGYTGKRRHESWMPDYEDPEVQRKAFP